MNTTNKGGLPYINFIFLKDNLVSRFSYRSNTMNSRRHLVDFLEVLLSTVKYYGPTKNLARQKTIGVINIPIKCMHRNEDEVECAKLTKVFGRIEQIKYR